jgi:cytochrome c biogenesis protein CcdA
MDLTLGIVTSAALLDSVNPCAISVLLLTIGFLISLGKVRSEIYKISFVYIFALYVTYLLIGLGVLQALSIFGFTNAVARVGAIILVGTAVITLLGAIFPKFPIKLKMPDSSHKILARYIEKASYPSALVLGVLVGLFEFPCTGGPYLSILSLLHTQASMAQGFAYLLYYNVVFVSPLIVIALVANSSVLVERLDKWRKKYTKRVDIVSSILMLLLAGIIFWSVNS